MQSSDQSTQEKKGQVWKRTHGEGKPCRSRAQETEDADSDDRREQSIGRDCAGLGRIIKGSQAQKDGGWTTAVAFWVSKFVPALTSRGWNTANKPLPRNWSDREIAYTELQATLGKEGIRLIRMRQGVSSGSDEQVGSSSQSSVTQTNEDKDEMDHVVGGEENVEDEEEVVRDDDDQEEVEEDVLDEKEEKEGEEDEDDDGEKVEDEVLEEEEEEGEEEEEESDVVRELLSKHSAWLGL
jgi:hypothetical protein